MCLHVILSLIALYLYISIRAIVCSPAPALTIEECVLCNHWIIDEISSFYSFKSFCSTLFLKLSNRAVNEMVKWSKYLMFLYKWCIICFWQGLVFPSMQLLLSKWAPSAERSQMVAFTYSGCQAGTVVGILVAGILCSTNSLGWPSVFYIFGMRYSCLITTQSTVQISYFVFNIVTCNDVLPFHVKRKNCPGHLGT